MSTIRIFLASSSELSEDRTAFKEAIGCKNKDLQPKGVFLHLDVWEDTSSAVSPTRSQDEYNKLIDVCDIFVVLFWTKVGKYTAEEFERAYGRFLDGGAKDRPLSERDTTCSVAFIDGDPKPRTISAAFARNSTFPRQVRPSRRLVPRIQSGTRPFLVIWRASR
jgi:hypothetical protein